MKPFSIASIQLFVSGTHENVTRMVERIGFVAAVFPWVQLIMFSELAAFGPEVRHAQPEGGPAELAFRAAAKQHGLWLLPGTLYTTIGGKIYNTAPVIDPEGNVVARAYKNFLFTPYEVGVEPGAEFTTFDIPGIGRFGVSICYDMWFPETSRTLACMGAEVLLHPSLTGTLDRDVELAIGRATAAQNQMFVFDTNGCGVGGTGQSVVVTPTGDILHQAGRSEEIMPIEIDLDRVRRSREVGLRCLGQPLKSFRDRIIEFPVYDRSKGTPEFLKTLGPLEKAGRGSLAGLNVEWGTA